MSCATSKAPKAIGEQKAEQNAMVSKLYSVLSLSCFQLLARQLFDRYHRCTLYGNAPVTMTFLWVATK